MKKQLLLVLYLKMTSVENIPALNEIKKALPSYVFVPNTCLSFYYLLKDFFLVYLAYTGIREYGDLYPILYPVYFLVQGTNFWALFVIGHDCGHGSFSRYEILNDTIGTIVHSLILVPYYPWKLSHRRHHRYTGHIDKDEIFNPIRDKRWSIGYRLSSICFQYLHGFSFWMYLLLGTHGSQWSRGHLMFSREFEKRYGVNTFYQRVQLQISRMCIVYMIYTIYHHYSYDLFLYYLMPVIVFIHWLVMVTFLHHFDEYTVWESERKWNFVSGALNSVDRDYGIFHHWTHSIGTHQVHHLFYKIPHYFLYDATTAFRQKFPELVRRNDEGIFEEYFNGIKRFLTGVRIGDDVESYRF